MTDFRNDQGTGSVIADTATIATVTGNLVGNVTGNVTGNVAGFTSLKGTPQLIAAAGATQGAATAITNSLVIITTCTASARGIKLPTAATGLMVYVMSACTQGTKVYPATNGRISSSATNTAVVQTGLKGKIYVAQNTTRWFTLAGA
jgi:hypothetical protein